jgi:hypothetical protein
MPRYEYKQVSLEEYYALGDAGVWVFWSQKDPARSRLDGRVSDHTLSWWKHRGVMSPFAKETKFYTRVEVDDDVS